MNPFYFLLQYGIVIGVGIVALTAVLAKIFLFGNKKKKAPSPITLEDLNLKYPLKLIDREVIFVLRLNGCLVHLYLYFNFIFSKISW